MADLKKVAQDILDLADVKIGGRREWDIQVKDDRFYSRVLSQGSLGLGESYMEGWWECKRLDKLMDKVLRAQLDSKVVNKLQLVSGVVKAKVMNLQKKSRAFKIGEHHYDIGNDLYTLMLDKRMAYTCGYWKKAKNLNQAQDAKLKLVCDKIGLKKGMKVLDIGCGWGSFAKFAAEKYKVKVVGITVSKEQALLAREKCKGLPVEIRLQDYRDVDEKFDRIVSLGMIEHVGHKNYKTYMKVAEKCLRPEGLFLLHTIGGLKSVKSCDPWITKYIFPNSMLPSVKQIADAAEGLFIVEDLHNFGPDYDKTLMAWFKNFDKGWNKIKNNYTEQFYRMWKYYLLVCAGSFRARKNQLWQIVLAKEDVKEGYKHRTH
ncbi:cyclopropane fatty acyl phospholipid synthase [Candidatus Woesearchaeota archaeon]|jgi:cyclopropane-fatty-acyl-phospholipid synthase|nr:cyclopropane fatty acyl phospholipid synthase [Candidatus Woesearchaeota archaeon]MBT3537902.1 cyclopropane fatty acyl phospholipid synthase [Candidatus Woesearchaeota archaeon]MBT4716959.1 cyclopropane fatty acyl phospholipid synthase [Candidatus Woesearchaeota archaeon]MBT7105571.1 cyclopropane fatty acyl phospholipid synthase [Candidatus Woesearchaeota archaeon]MBT7931428.1 cyclopropane fatty acyl phospholipid synthase [Candidatus Woesearchaeota archaeon]